ncbi:MAG: hypothetical protein KKH88_00750 [Nanoarchaeota archaeon]|nr:hypothetical protein [Nanoarchaeota archaeon]MBU1445329.1 hypothetical protein [Nanoarchaeota archaeon]MBU2420522.1 hypothetical protein [Nanoarchaeota archaeon]MBU2475120.1 hypothetical protein [Nanoarchaeota archaeon]MBU3940444.1 hypothetical protein [Nanoarchaeota archaeon]
MKRGQLQIQESIIVIFIIIVLFLMGFILFYRFTVLDIQNQIDKHDTFEFRQLINVIPNMAELKCSELGVNDDCIDILKLQGYIRLGVADFEDKKIILQNLQTLEAWELYDDEPRRYDSVLRISSPVSLFYPLEEKHYYGVLIIEWYK